MSVQDPITYPISGEPQKMDHSQVWRQLMAGSVLCFAIVLIWTADFVNVAQLLAAAVVLSIGLSARAVLKIDEVEHAGLAESSSLAETIVGSVLLSILAAVSLIAASTSFAPLGGVGQFTMFVSSASAMFGAMLAIEAFVSGCVCFILKPMLSKSPIGAEIGVMLNLQQKYQTRLA